MKKVAVLMAFIACLATPSVSKAQVKFGVRGGLNASNVSFEKLPNRSETFGFHVGGFADIAVSPDFMSIQPELSYSVQGTKFKPATESKSLRLNYVDILVPVAFKLSAFDLQVGPFASFLASKADYTSHTDNKVVASAFKKFDLGLTAGLTYNFGQMLVGVRYNQGFVDATTDVSRPLLGSGKNAVGQVSFGYKF
jgi:Outer membrane protein beta-barrel domain